MPTLSSPIGVLIVDDSTFMRNALKDILNKDPAISVLGTAANGLEGIRLLQALRPQVVTMDVQMPVMDGLDALGEIMRWQPTPVIMLSSVTSQGAAATLKAFDLGAFDAIAKPDSRLDNASCRFVPDLIERIKAAAVGNLSRLTQKSHSGEGHSGSRTFADQVEAQPEPFTLLDVHTDSDAALPGKTPLLTLPKEPVEIVAIGISTGGPGALQSFLPELPAEFPVPVIVVQHMPAGFTRMLAQRLDNLCKLTVCEAKDGDVLSAGTVYIAPAAVQTQVERSLNKLILRVGGESPIPTLYHPSVDVMLLSLVKQGVKGTLGVIMTGMGSDGVRGVREVRSIGGFTIAESEESCVVYGMPRAVVEAGLADRIVPLGKIAATLVECVQRR